MAEALGPVLGDFEFDTTGAVLPMAIHIDGEYYAVVYRRSASSSWLKTYRITAAGVITEIDTWEYTTDDAKDHRIKYISGTLYAITYRFFDSTYNRGRLKTLHISNTGAITKSFDDTYNIGTQYYPGFLFHIWGAYFVLIAGHSPNLHYIFSLTIQSGAGGITEIDSYNYPSFGAEVTAAGQISSNIYFAAFPADTYYRIYTFQVSNTGVITTPYMATDDFAFNCGHTLLRSTKVANNIFAIGLFNSDISSSSIQTVQINNDGSIEGTLKDDFTLAAGIDYIINTVYTGTPNLYYIVYPGTDTHGFIDIVNINAVGKISDAPAYAAFEFDDVRGIYPYPLPTNGIFIPVFYIGPDDHGWVKSITFTPPAPVAHHEMIMNIGP